jgi:hypothetical protein
MSAAGEPDVHQAQTGRLIDVPKSNRVRLIDIERLKSLEGNEAEI